MAECLEGEARVVVLAARRDALILLSVEELGEDDGGDGEEDEAEELVVDAEDEAGAVAVEALVNLNSIERWKGKGGQRRELFDSDFCMILAGLVLSGRCTYHGEGGEGLRDEAGDRGGEHRLLGHGSLGDGGLGDCGGGEMRGNWSDRRQDALLGLELTSPASRLIAPRVRSWDVERGLTGGLAGNLAGRGLCEGHGKDTGDRGQRRSHVARSSAGGFVNNRHLWLKSMRARGDLNLKRARVRVRSRRYSLAATAHFMERDMQAILCVVDTVYATGVVCDYAPPRASPHPENTRRHSRLASWIDCSSKIRRSDWLSGGLKSHFF